MEHGHKPERERERDCDCEFTSTYPPPPIKALADGKPFMLDPTEPIMPSILLLLIYLVVFLGMIHMNGWALTTRLGYQFFGLHLVFVVYSAVSFYVSV